MEGWRDDGGLSLFVGCLTSQQHASVSQGRICSDNFTCCHTEIEVADQTFHLTQSQYTDTGPTSPSTDPITPDAWQGSHWSANFEITGMIRPGKIPSRAGFELRTFRSRGVRLNPLATEAVRRIESWMAWEAVRCANKQTNKQSQTKYSFVFGCLTISRGILQELWAFVKQLCCVALE